MEEVKILTVEVAFALPDEQCIISLDVDEGCTAMQAIEQSAILDRYPSINLDKANIGIFGKVLSGEDNPDRYILKGGDRVEIYRPLIADPKESRRQRAEKSKASK